MQLDEARVLAANAVFYETFAAGDLRAMDELWARSAQVTCIHPGWDVLLGREAVLLSWSRILGGAGNEIEGSRPHASVVGDVATVVCLEGAKGEAPSLVATNVFVREAGEWKMVHHHAGPLARRPERT